jgi:hypothetical protein
MRCSLLVLLVGLAACGDEPTKESPLPKPTPTADASKKATPTAAKPTPAKKAAPVTARSVRASTVCTRYRTRLAATQRQLAANPGSVVLKRRQASLQSLVADACQ